MKEILTHLARLESEAIHIMREVVAEAENTVMLYSVGKDSAALAESQLNQAALAGEDLDRKFPAVFAWPTATRG